MALQPILGRDDFPGQVPLPENFLQKVGALEQQQPLILTPRTSSKASQTLDQAIASAADQGGEGIQRMTQNAACLRTFKPF